jgi:hypothetical protein
MKFNGRHILSKGALAAALLWMSVAQAANYQFTITGNDGFFTQWQMASAGAPGIVDPGFAFGFYGVTGNFQGATHALADLSFYATVAHGGLHISDADTGDILFGGLGEQLYTGPESHPVFKLGVFALSDRDGNNLSYSLKVTDLAAPPVPEPETYAMLLGGLGLIGFVARRRKLRA